MANDKIQRNRTQGLIMEITKILEERTKDYGEFQDLAWLSQRLKRTLKYAGEKENALKPYQKEALEMILHKIARIINGDNTKKDTWNDIAGYAILVSNILKEENDSN